MDIRGTEALVCGASEGIGKATALNLATKGFRVTILSRSAEKLLVLKQKLDEVNGLDNRYIAVDLSNTSELKKSIEQLGATTDISVVINNNAGPKAGPLWQASPEELLNGFTSHVIAAQTILRILLPGMKRSGYGRIVNIISTSVKAPIAGLGVSNTIRGAMANWSKTLATELGPEGITVNNVLPGFTSTGRLNNLIQGKSDKQNKSEAEIISDMQKTIPIGRFAKPEETAAAIAFLVSPEASYISGINLPVDGGRTSSL